MDTKESVEIGFLNGTHKIYDSKRISRRFLAGFSAIFAAAFFLGTFFCKKVAGGISDSMSPQIASHFSGIFSGCQSPTDYFTVIISASSADLRSLVLIFASGFTYFCKYATGAMLAFRAFTLGFSFEFLAFSLKRSSVVLDHPLLSMMIFLSCELMIAALIVYLSVKSVFFGDDFRRLRGRKSLILRSPIIYRYIFLFLTAFGLVIAVNSAYCAISALT